jgi:phage terminase large subunit GpA-like protein
MSDAVYICSGATYKRPAGTALASGDHAEIQGVMNAAFGQCYSITGGGDVPDWEDLRATRCLPYKRGEIPDGAIRLIMGVDVQKWSIYYSARAFGAQGTSWLVDWGQLHGPTAMDQVWDDLRQVMTAPIGGMAISRVMIDSGFRPDKKDSGDEHKVYEFVRRHRWLCHACKGRSQDSYRQPYTVSRPEVSKDGKKQKGARSVDLTWLSSDWFKSLVMSRINTEVGEPGAFYLPEDVDEDYCRQLVSEERLIIDGKARWVKRFRDNHFLDCEALAAAGAFSLNVHQIPDRTPAQMTTALGRSIASLKASVRGDEPEDAARGAEKAPPPKALQSRRRRSEWKAYR